MELKPGYKQTELGVIPEDWEAKHLFDIATVVRGGSPRPAGDPKFFGGDFIPWLTVAALTNISSNQMVVAETAGYLTESGSTRSRTLDTGTIIIANSGATLGVAKILGMKCCANDGIAALINQKDGDQQFICHYINTKTKHLREVVATGNGQPNLNTGLIGNMMVPYPPLPEQRAIAGALSDIDALLSSLDRLLVKKRDIKQAVMQQLLTGKQRLPGFNGKWGSEQLGKLVRIAKGQQLNRAELSSTTGFPAWNGGVEPSGFTDTWNTAENTITISEGGNSCGFVGFVNQKFWCGGHCYALLDVKADLDKVFLYYLLKSKQQLIMGLRMGSGLPNIQRKYLSELLLLYPSLPEQSAIAAVLADMDAEIDALQQRCDKTRAIKQGMMQELLTGRTRLI